MPSKSVAQWISGLIHFRSVTHEFKSHWGFQNFYLLIKNFFKGSYGVNIVKFENSKSVKTFYYYNVL